MPVIVPLPRRENPRRFIQALYDATEGYDGDPKLLRVFAKVAHPCVKSYLSPAAWENEPAVRQWIPHDTGVPDAWPEKQDV